MKNREFDDALRDFVQGNSLPYDPLQWDRMTQRLAAYDDAQKPAADRRRIIPLYRWAAAAAAACLVGVAVWYIDPDRIAPNVSHPYAGTEQNAGTEQRTSPEQQISQGIANDKNTTQQAPDASPQATARAARRNERRDPEPVVRGYEVATVPPAVTQHPQAVPDNTPAIVKSEPAKPEKANRGDQPLPSFSQEQDEAELPRERKLAFGINGGYNIGQAKNNFTIGVTVNRKLGSRLQLETGLALVSGTRETYQAVMVADRTITGMATNSYTTEYEAQTSPLLYLQAAPSLNYRIFKGISAGGGVDAQRLLGNQPQTATLNKLGEQEAAQPQWDFGLTARVDFRVVKKLRAGMMYRESIGAVSKGAGEAAARRNYLLLQLSYIIF